MAKRKLSLLFFFGPSQLSPFFFYLPRALFCRSLPETAPRDQKINLPFIPFCGLLWSLETGIWEPAVTWAGRRIREVQELACNLVKACWLVATQKLQERHGPNVWASRNATGCAGSKQHACKLKVTCHWLLQLGYVDRRKTSCMGAKVWCCRKLGGMGAPCLFGSYGPLGKRPIRWSGLRLGLVSRGMVCCWNGGALAVWAMGPCDCQTDWPCRSWAWVLLVRDRGGCRAGESQLWAGDRPLGPLRAGRWSGAGTWSSGVGEVCCAEAAWRWDLSREPCERRRIGLCSGYVVQQGNSSWSCKLGHATKACKREARREGESRQDRACVRGMKTMHAWAWVVGLVLNWACRADLLVLGLASLGPKLGSIKQ